MENDILEILEDVCYSGPLLEESRLAKAIEGGAKSVDFTELVAWLSTELKSLCKLDEHVSPISSPEDSSSFLLELSSFLKELGCPYSILTEGHVNDRLQSRACRTTLLSFLLSELQAARMLEAVKPDRSAALRVQLHESSTATDLKNLLMALRFPKPPDNISPAMLFGKVEVKMKEVVSRASPALLGRPLFTGQLSESQWGTLATLQEELQLEYLMRRQMLLKRLDVTIQSFQWSDRVNSSQDQIVQIFRQRRDLLQEAPAVVLADLLAAREDLAVLEKTSCSAVRKNTQSAVNRVLIGQVPDRGGRPADQQAPPPEMPSWQPRSSGQQGGGGGGGRGGGGRGGGGYRGGGGGGRGGRGGEGGGSGWGRGGEGGGGYRGGEGGGRGGRGGDGGGSGWGRGGEGRVQGSWSRGGGQGEGGFQGGRGRGGGYRGRGRGQY